MNSRRISCALAIVFAGCVYYIVVYQPSQTRNARSTSNTSEVDVVEVAKDLSDGKWETRKQAMETLRVKRADSFKAVNELIRVIEEDRREGPFSPKVLASRLLGEWQERTAIPVLVKKIDFESDFEVIRLRQFYMEAYPCAEAISKMGPSAITPTLQAIANQSEPLTLKSVRVTAYLIVSLCDNSKEDAIAAIRKAEKLYPESKNLHPIRMYIEHFMDFHKNLERQRAEPSA